MSTSRVDGNLSGFYFRFTSSADGHLPCAGAVTPPTPTALAMRRAAGLQNGPAWD